MIFEMKNIVKMFGSLVANDNVNIHLDEGEILAIVGENGAGKSTIMKILYGLEKPTSGDIYVRGKRVRFHNPSDAMNHGIGMVQQHFMLFESMTVAENIVFKNEIKKGPFLDRKAMFAKVQALSDQYKLKIDPQATIEECPVGLRQRVEILKILYQNAEIIIFDEPSAVLTPLEVESLLETIKQLAAMGKSIVLITHKLQEVMSVADRIYVMRAGKVVAERQKNATNVEELSTLMIGHQLVTREIPPCHSDTCLLNVQDLTLVGEGRQLLKEVSLHLNAGEIVGIAGVSGNGQSDLILCITGLHRASSGSVTLCEKDVTNHSVSDIRNAGLAHISEDRFLWGSALEGTLYENALMGKEDNPVFCKHGFLHWKDVRAYADRLIQQFGVKASSCLQKMHEMSGGNAQKLIVARELCMDTPVLVCCEPTRGLDVGAMEFIHEQMVKKRSEGGGVLLVSSELSEIMQLSDRIYVMFEGKINGEFLRGAVDDKRLGLLMLGGAVQ